MMPNTSWHLTPVTPGSFRCGFPVGVNRRRRGSALDRQTTLHVMRIFALSFITVLMFTGCCTSISTSVRNETGRDIHLTAVWRSQQVESVTIHAKSTGRCSGVMPAFPGQPPESWIISDGQSRFTFADVSPIGSMPSRFISSTRFTRDFPCKRVTQHVRIAADMTIHAVRVIGYTDSEPAPFPINYTNKEDER